MSSELLWSPDSVRHATDTIRAPINTPASGDSEANLFFSSALPSRREWHWAAGLVIVLGFGFAVDRHAKRTPVRG
jgi:hypothetical protein